MSDASKSIVNSKRRWHEIDDTIENMTLSVKRLTINDYALKSELECSIMAAKLKREKVKALSAAVKSQLIVSEMEILLAEADLYSDLVRLKNYKKTKLENYGLSHQHTSRSARASTPISTSRSKSKSKNSQEQVKKTITVKKEPSLDETVLVATIDENNEHDSDKENAQSLANQVLNKDCIRSDSEVSIPNSIAAEFINNPYPNSSESLNNSKESKSSQSTSKSSKSKRLRSPKIKTVAEINKNLNIKFSTDNNSHNIIPTSSKLNRKIENKLSESPVTSTYVPNGQTNMPIIAVTTQKHLFEPSTSRSSVNPCIYINTRTSTSNLCQTPFAMNNGQNLKIFGSKQ